MNQAPQAVRYTRRLILVIALAVLTTTVTFAAAPTPDVPVSSSATAVTVQRSDAAQLTFSLSLPAYTVDAAGHIDVAGLNATLEQPGAPALPYYRTLIALPPGATVRVDVQPGAFQTTPLAAVKPAAGPDLGRIDARAANLFDGTAPGTAAALPAASTPDPLIYGVDALYPDTTVVLSEPLYLRDLRVVELKLFPVRYNPQQQTMQQAHSMQIDIRFEGVDLSAGTGQPLSAYTDRYAADVLNIDPARSWGTLPDAITTAANTRLPLGTDVFKIVVAEDGIYEVTGAELQAAGMAINSVDPAAIKMLYRGEPVAYQFVDANNNGKLNVEDAIRFYGWAFDGPRFEKMYVGAQNVFWLWAGASGTAVHIDERNNQAGQGFPLAASFRDAITTEPELAPFPAWGINWDESPNDPDNFHMGFFTAAASSVGTAAYTIALPDPATGGQDIQLTAEFTPRLNTLNSAPFTYTVTGYLNDDATAGQVTWTGWKNVNLQQAFPANLLKQPGSAGYPDNTLKLELTSDAAVQAEVYINRITVAYDRALTAVDDQLIFNAGGSGNREFRVSGFSEATPGNVLVWDITDRLAPVAVKMRAQDITGSGSLTYKIGGSVTAGSTFIATHHGQVKSVAALSKYRPESIDPPNGHGRWLAITHPDFMNAANQLAQFRSQTGLSTHVVDVQDIVAQFGYGFNTPTAISDYVRYAIGNWDAGPEYILLFGDATVNPRQLSCEVKCSFIWDTSAKTYVVTYLAFRDRFQGLIPSDFEYSLLSGDDLYPDIAVGRVPASSAANAQTMVQKIILYEDQRATDPRPWQKNILFVADDPDNGGDFCVENEQSRPYIPASFPQVHLCLEEATAAKTDALRAEMSRHVNDIGIAVMNYRGHGAIDTWAATGGSPPILSTATADFWLNQNKPVIIVSADCLDGYFGWPGINALGETFMRDTGVRGTVAHWGSAGLGYTFEHSVLQKGFYEGLFANNLIRLGDAVNFARLKYVNAGQDKSELYGFSLLGDPAMKIIPYGVSAGPNGLYLPAVLRGN